MPAKKTETGSLSIHTENIFPIIKKWLYSQHDIFLRELISNAVDAINKRKYADPDFKEEEMPFFRSEEKTRINFQLL